VGTISNKRQHAGEERAAGVPVSRARAVRLADASRSASAGGDKSNTYELLQADKAATHDLEPIEQCKETPAPCAMTDRLLHAVKPIGQLSKYSSIAVHPFR